MKKIVCLVFCVIITQIKAQNPTYQQKLFYTCKIWGFVKYFHSGVSTCSVNWDSILVSRLPKIKNAVTNNDFNDELDTLLNAAGPMAIASGVLPDTIQPELKRNRDFSWISHPIIRNDVKVILDTIKNNFRPHASCWVQNNPYTNNYTGYLLFQYDSLMLNSDTYTAFPNEATRLLVAFKYWNILNYFNPYNYVLDKPIDSTLYNKILLVASAVNDQAYYFAIKKITSDLDDAHAEGLTWSTHISPPNYYYAPPIELLYTQGKYVVVNTTLSPIKRGDIVTSVNGQPTSVLENNLRPFVSAGDSSVFHRFMCQYILNGYYNTSANIGYLDSLGNNNTISTTRTDYIYSSVFSAYYPNDTLANVKWKKFGCNVGYVNMGKLLSADVNTMYTNLRNCSSIIFDIRNYPNGTGPAIANKMYPNKKMFSKLTLPDVTYPGTFSWYLDYAGVNGNTTPYTGKVIILMNEQTQSQAEFTCMLLENMTNSVKVGSQTAGADGNITYFKLSQDMQAGFTNLGVYYPNGDSTQRIGIRPDTLIYPTPMGIRLHKDEVLEKALEIASCLNYMQNTMAPILVAEVFPNPNNGNFTLSTNSTQKGIAQVLDLTGNIVLSQIISNGKTEFNSKDLDAGAYLIQINIDGLMTNKKLIISK